MAKKYKNPTAGLSLEEAEHKLQEILGGLSHGYRLPYMQWFEDDFRGSEGVEDMLPLERLIYRQLLAKAWCSKDAPYLPADGEKLFRLSDCPSEELWEKHRKAVLGMFRRSSLSNKMFHPRQLLDYIYQVDKVVQNTANGSLGGQQKRNNKQAKTEDSDPLANGKQTPSERSSEKVAIKNYNQNQIKNDNEINNENEERDDSDHFSETEEHSHGEEMKAINQVPLICKAILGEYADMSPLNTMKLKALEMEHKGSAVVNIFTLWANEHKHDDIKKPITAFLREADDLFATPSSSFVSSVSPENGRKVGREISYISRQDVNLDKKQMALVAEAMAEEDYTEEEVYTVFRTFYNAIDKTNTKELSFAGLKFSQVVGNLLYAERRKKQESEAEQAAMDTARERMQAEATLRVTEMLRKEAEEQEASETELS